MAVTMEQVRAELDSEEPNYTRAAGLGPEAIPHLEELMRSRDPLLASKAVYLVGLIRDARSPQLLESAAGSDEPRLRVAAAAAARHMSEEAAGDVLLPLVRDDDAGVRKVALKSVPPEPSADLRAAVEELAESEDEATRRLSQETLRRLTE